MQGPNSADSEIPWLAQSCSCECTRSKSEQDFEGLEMEGDSMMQDNYACFKKKVLPAFVL